MLSWDLHLVGHVVLILVRSGFNTRKLRDLILCRWSGAGWDGKWEWNSGNFKITKRTLFSNKEVQRRHQWCLQIQLHLVFVRSFSVAITSRIRSLDLLNQCSRLSPFIFLYVEQILSFTKLFFFRQKFLFLFTLLKLKLSSTVKLFNVIATLASLLFYREWSYKVTLFLLCYIGIGKKYYLCWDWKKYYFSDFITSWVIGLLSNWGTTVYLFIFSLNWMVRRFVFLLLSWVYKLVE